MENPEGEGLRTANPEELIDGWEASANRTKPSFDSADFESALYSPTPTVIITLDVGAAACRWRRAGRCDAADKSPDWLCSMMRHFSLFIPIIFPQTVFFGLFFLMADVLSTRRLLPVEPSAKRFGCRKVSVR